VAEGEAHGEVLKHRGGVLRPAGTGGGPRLDKRPRNPPAKIRSLPPGPNPGQPRNSSDLGIPDIRPGSRPNRSTRGRSVIARSCASAASLAMGGAAARSRRPAGANPQASASPGIAANPAQRQRFELTVYGGSSRGRPWIFRSQNLEGRSCRQGFHQLIMKVVNLLAQRLCQSAFRRSGGCGRYRT
jgi:hypothetical protein